MPVLRTIALLIILFIASRVDATKFTYNENKLGGDFRLILYMSEQRQADLVSKEAYTLVDSLNRIMSNYLSGSEINKFNRNKKLDQMSVCLRELLIEAQTAYIISNGYFDISVKPLIDLWDKAERRGKVPGSTKLERMNKYVGLEKVLTQKNGIFSLKKKSALDLGGIGKGFIIDKVYAFLLEKKVSSFLIEAAGDIRVHGKPENAESWLISVSSTNRSNVLVQLESSQAIATSGKTYRYRVIDGKQYSHIINPKSMTPVKHNVTSSVVAENAMKADYLASAFNIIIDENLRNEILDQNDQVALMLLRKQQVIFRSQNFPVKESLAE